jgi:putative endonuclease
MPFLVYMLRCGDGTLYVGSTNDIEKRLHKHNHLKTGARYTRQRRPVELVYTEKYESLSEALKREYALKQYSRLQKLSLLTGVATSTQSPA